LGSFTDIDEEGNQKGNSDNGGHCLFVSIVDKHRSQRPNHSMTKDTMEITSLTFSTPLLFSKASRSNVLSRIAEKSL